MAKIYGMFEPKAMIFNDAFITSQPQMGGDDSFLFCALHGINQRYKTFFKFQ